MITGYEQLDNLFFLWSFSTILIHTIAPRALSRFIWIWNKHVRGIIEQRCFYCGYESRLALNQILASLSIWHCKECKNSNVYSSDSEGHPVEDSNEMMTLPWNNQSSGPEMTGSYSYTRPFSGSDDLYLWSSEMSVESTTLCQICTHNQALTQKLLSSFDPPNQAYFDSYADAYKRELEDRYPPLCKTCAPKVDRRLYDLAKKAQRRILKDTIEDSLKSMENDDLLNRKSTFVPILHWMWIVKALVGYVMRIVVLLSFLGFHIAGILFPVSFAFSNMSLVSMGQNYNHSTVLPLASWQEMMLTLMLFCGVLSFISHSYSRHTKFILPWMNLSGVVFSLVPLSSIPLVNFLVHLTFLTWNMNSFFSMLKLSVSRTHRHSFPQTRRFVLQKLNTFLQKSPSGTPLQQRISFQPEIIQKTISVEIKKRFSFQEQKEEDNFLAGQVTDTEGDARNEEDEMLSYLFSSGLDKAFSFGSPPRNQNDKDSPGMGTVFGKHERRIPSPEEFEDQHRREALRRILITTMLWGSRIFQFAAVVFPGMVHDTYLECISIMFLSLMLFPQAMYSTSSCSLRKSLVISTLMVFWMTALFHKVAAIMYLTSLYDWIAEETEIFQVVPVASVSPLRLYYAIPLIGLFYL